MNRLSREIHENNKAKGFYDEGKNIGEILALIHSEVSEALEAHRSGNVLRKCPDVDVESDEEFKTLFEAHVKDSFNDELADVIIRVLDLAGYLEIDIESHVKAKVRYNTLRPRKHGKKY